MLPAAISSGSTAQGHSLMKACASGRLRGPGPNAPSIGVTGRKSPKVSS
jgi:hypothetical protein